MTQGEHLSGYLNRDTRSLNQIAKAAGITREHLSKVAHDKRNLTDDVAAKLARVLDVSFDELVLPREVEVESRRGLDRRLQQVEADTRLLRSMLLRVADSAGVVLPELQDDEQPPRAHPNSES